MKLVVAFICPERLEVVQASLRPLGVSAAYISTAGDLEQATVGSYRGGQYFSPLPRTRLEVVVFNDKMLQETVDTIAVAAAIDARGNKGCLFVMPLQAWIRAAGNDTGEETEREDARYVRTAGAASK